jgi:hypothetical protein
MGFRAGSNSRSQAIVLLAAGAGGIVVIGLILALVRPASVIGPSPSPSSSQPPTPPPTPTQFTVPLDIAAQLNLGAHAVSAMAVTTDDVWLATHGATAGDTGTLFRVDAATARVTASWTVGGAPVAVAASGSFVWVANGSGGTSVSPPEHDTVEQFNATTGALMHLYHVSDPQGLVANAASAMVVAANNAQQTSISLLNAGNTKPVTTLSGVLAPPVSSLSPQVAVSVCSDRVFLALTRVVPGASNVTIYSLPPTGGAVRKLVTVPYDYEASTACDGTSVFLIGDAGDGDASIARVSITDGTVTNLWEGPYPVSVAFLSGRVWIAYSDDALNESALTSLDPATGIAMSTRSILPAPSNGGDPNLLLPGDSGLWLVAAEGNLLLHVATG